MNYLSVTLLLKDTGLPLDYIEASEDSDHAISCPYGDGGFRDFAMIVSAVALVA
jgi:hypothetical protein